MSPAFYTEAALVERPALELLAELGWEVVDAYGETLGPAGTLGRDSKHDVVLTHRLRDALRLLNSESPDDVREEALAAIAKDRSAMDPVPGQPRGLRPAARRLPGRVARRPRRAALRDRALHRLPRLDEERLAGGVAGVDRRRHAQPAGRRRAVRQRHPAGAGRVQGDQPAGQGGVRREPHRLPRHDPAAVLAQRVRDPVQRLGGQGRRDVRAVGVLRRLEADRRRRHPRRGRVGDGDPGHLHPRPAARSDRELRRLPRTARRADQVASLATTSTSGSTRRSRTCTASARRATPGSGCSGTRRARARACRCCGSRRRCCAACRVRGRS